jgi:hypothetical protein
MKKRILIAVAMIICLSAQGQQGEDGTETVLYSFATGGRNARNRAVFELSIRAQGSGQLLLSNPNGGASVTVSDGIDPSNGRIAIYANNEMPGWAAVRRIHSRERRHIQCLTCR